MALAAAVYLATLGKRGLRQVAELCYHKAHYAAEVGCELAMACDIRIASANARFGQPEINIGIIPGSGGTQRLPRLIDWGKAKELIYTGRIIDANEAERIGLVDRVVPQSELEKTVNQLAETIASKSPLIIK